MEVLYDIYISKDSFNGDSNTNVLEKFSQKYKMTPDDFLKMLESRTNVRIAQNKTKNEIELLYSRLNKLNIKVHIREHLEIAKDNANGDSASQSQATSTSNPKRQLSFDEILENIEKYTILGINYITFFPIILINKFFKKRFTEMAGYLLLSALSFVGIYHLAFKLSYNVIYDMAYDFSFKSLIGTATAYSVFELLHKFTPLPGVGKIADWLANGLIALSIQTILLKIVKEGFIAKYIFSAGFLLCAFKVTQVYGKRMVLSAVFIYVLMPGIVSLESATYKMSTASTFEKIETKYKEFGGTLEFIKEGFSTLKNIIFSSSDSKSRSKAGEFAEFLLESLIYLLVMTLFYCIISPFIAYILISRILKKIFESDGSYICYEKVCQTATTT
jgi:hypothetical protein